MDAVVAGAVALVVAALTSWVSVYLQREKLRQELRTEFMAEQALVDLLDQPDWTLRTFTSIEKRIGGFEENELRRLLVRSGALRFEGDDGAEMWGLRRRNVQRLKTR